MWLSGRKIASRGSNPIIYTFFIFIFKFIILFYLERKPTRRAGLLASAELLVKHVRE